jgi:BlaI family transcriptional regulator, penicillinase repressor
MAKQVPKISEAEWVVMKRLWAENPATANAVVEALAGATAWNPKTIRTLLNRLVRKKAVGYRKEGREYLYRPLVSQAQCARAESRSFLQRVYGGALKPMLAAFLENEALSAEDISELKQLLDQKKGG